MLGVVLALALPGVASAGPKGKVALGVLMAAQGLVVCVVEDRLYGHAHEGRQCQRFGSIFSYFSPALSYQCPIFLDNDDPCELLDKGLDSGRMCGQFWYWSSI
jgi:hypothetical protein